jgi:hypothetical protein
MRFRKRPVEVEAVRFEVTKEGIEILKAFCGEALGRVLRPSSSSPAEAEICTLEDGKHMRVRHVAFEGDWVIKGIGGEIYPCKPDVFESSYEPVQE